MKGSCNDVKPSAESIIVSKPEMRPLDAANSSPASAVATAEESKQLPVPFVFNFNQPTRNSEGSNSQTTTTNQPQQSLGIQGSVPTSNSSSLDFASALLSRNLREGAKVNGIYPIQQQFIDPDFLTLLNSPASDSTQRTAPQAEVTRQESLTADPTIVSTPQVAPHSILDVAATQLAPASLTKELQRTETNFAGISSNIHFPPNVISPVTEMQIHKMHSISNPVSDPIYFQTSAAHEPVAAPITQLVLQSDFAVGFSSPVAVVSRTPREYIPTLESPHVRSLGVLPKPPSAIVSRVKEAIRAKEESRPKDEAQKGAEPPELKKNTKVATKEDVAKTPLVAKPAVAAKSSEATTNTKAKPLDTKATTNAKVETTKTTSVKISFAQDPQFAYAKRALAEFKLRLGNMTPVFSGTGFFCATFNPNIDKKIPRFSLYYLLGLIGQKKKVRSSGSLSGFINRLIRKITS
jgi:hypothetical protein